MTGARPDQTEVQITWGVRPADRMDAAMLFDLAFGPKLAVMIPDEERRRKVLAEAVNLDRAIAAYDGETLRGLCGFHHEGQSFTGGLGAALLFRRLGLRGGARACLVGALLQRKAEPSELLMDGVAVSPHARGGGIGSRLLMALKEFARVQGYRRIRLDVVDSNPRARSLYERHGFVATARRATSWLTSGMGFTGVTTMTFPVPAEVSTEAQPA